MLHYPLLTAIQNPSITRVVITAGKYSFDNSRHVLTRFRTMDYDYVGKASSTVGIWLIRSNHEKASGGPFFRSLLRGCTTDHEDLYEILYYNMGTTDPERFGLQGPYVLSFTTGATPNTALFARKADVRRFAFSLDGLSSRSSMMWNRRLIENIVELDGHPRNHRLGTKDRSRICFWRW